MKILNKVMICLAIISFSFLMVCSMVIPTFAWQNTNEQIYDIVVDGGTSYGIMPIKSMYMTMPRSGNYEDGYYTRSVQHQNVYKVQGKGNFQDVGLPLNGTRTEVQNNYSDIIFGFSDLNPQLLNLTEEERQKVGYLGLRSEDGGEISPGNTKGVNFDEFIYDIHTYAPYHINRSSFNVEFNDFVISQTILSQSNVLVISPEYVTGNYGTTSKILITYTIISKNDDGEVTYTYVQEFWDKTNELRNTTLSIGGYEYEGYYTHYDIGKHIYEHIPTDKREYVMVKGLQVFVGGNWEDTAAPFPYAPDKVTLKTNYYRPYINGWDNALDPFSDDIPRWFRTIDYKNVEDFNRGSMSVSLDGFGALGNAVGDTVEGVFSVELIPGITIWTILLIPLSLGILFAVLRFFAGG